MDAGSTRATCEVAGCGLSRWKIEEKKRFGAAARGGLGPCDALYDSDAFSRVKLTGFSFV
jgi:hypothetical protein